jgi:3-oxoacyl-[acyl-carrier protein] reductase
MNELEGRVALVTGSSRGIGATIVRLFAAEGAAVAVHGRDPEAAAAVCARIEGDGGRACAVLGDLTDYGEVEAMRGAIEGNFGPVDVLVANSGDSLIRPGPVEDISPEDWRASLDVNLSATFFSIKAFLPAMKQRGRGNIITLSSAAARRPNPGSPIAYAAAKAGVELLTKDVAAQAGPAGVRVNCIAPEIIMTERNQAEIPASVQESLRNLHPIRRLGTPEDVARAALFLATDNSAWITGITIDVAGGAVLV